MKRIDLIAVYTSFVSMYVLQQMENPNFLDARKLEELGQIDLNVIERASHVLRFQSREVVAQIFEIMANHIPPHNGPGKIDWATFADLARQLIPSSLEDKLDLFLTSYVPKEHLAEAPAGAYEFSQDEILALCRSCLGLLFKEQNDLFFTEMSESYAKIIYYILGAKWSDDPKSQVSIPLTRLKKTICEADGYEREMLSLLYGAVGVMSLDHRSDVI